MPSSRWKIKIGALCLALVFGLWPVQGRAVMQSTHLLYSIHWSGLHIADLVVSIEEDAKHYRVQSFAHTRGLVKLISKYFNHATVSGDKRDGQYIPRDFRTDFQVRHDRRTITMTFDAEGKPLSLISDPPEKRWKRKEVPVEERLGAVEVQTLGMRLRALLDARKTSLPYAEPMKLFDGRRLSRMDVTLEKPEKLAVSFLKQPPDVVPIVLRRTALLGYTDNELKRIEEGEDVVFRFYAPVKGKRYPLYIKAQAELGMATGMFVQECASRDACLQAAEIEPVEAHR